MVERIWHLLNYLCVGMLYLKDNSTLTRSLCKEDFKSDIVGHWGTCPSVNAIYSHLINYRIKHNNSNEQIKLVISTGHAAPSLLAASFLDGTLQKYYPEFTRDVNGITRLFNSYGNTFSSEIDAMYPGNIYCGGELGAGLAFSQGYVFNHPERIVVCVIGDGEFETPVCQASFQGFDFLDRQKDGHVIPVINLNGYKMGGESMLAHKTDTEIIGYFNYFGIETIFANDCHEDIAKAFEKCFSIIKDGKHPVLVIKTPKGWTAPKIMGGIPFEGTNKSHKPVLRHPYCDDTEFKEVKKWLESYNINSFFSEGVLNPEIVQYLDKIISSVIDFERSYYVNPKQVVFNQHFDSNTIPCCNLLSNQNDVIIFSPDELDSNGFGDAKKKCRVIELLSEQTCFGWAYGYAAGGGMPILITYEAFAPLFDSMVDQYLKVSEAIMFMNCSFPSINIIITSLGWKNVPSHHNPGFVDRLIGYDSAQINLSFPLSPSNTLQQLNENLSTNNKLNIIVIDKRKLPVLYNKETNIQKGYWEFCTRDEKKYNLIVIVIGDIVAEEALKAYDMLSSQEKSLVKIIGLDNPLIQIDTIKKETHNSNFNIWVYNGRTSALESLLWRHCYSPTKNKVLGYLGKSRMPSGVKRLQENKIDAMSIANTIKHVLNIKEENNENNKRT